MPIPLLFIGVAAATGGFGISKTIQAGIDSGNATNINKNANELIKTGTDWLNAQRLACGRSLGQLGEEKLFILNSSVTSFLDTFTKIKNVDFREVQGLDELSKLHIDEKEFVELESLANYAGSIAGGALAGTASGALIALGAYGAAQALAVASTGTAIASLSGVAATNATLAFFGGGSLAAGGLGMAGGMVVLGGLVAGPALALFGSVVSATAKKNLDEAYTNQAQAIQLAEELSVAGKQCEVIRRRTYMLYNLLARLDAIFVPLLYDMEDIFKLEGDDYSKYTEKSKKKVASCASIAVTIKAVLDTPLLNDDGILTDQSGKILESSEEAIKKVEHLALGKKED